MMDRDLVCGLLFSGAQRGHHHAEIVTRTTSGEVHRDDHEAFAAIAQQLMWALDDLGLARGAVAAPRPHRGARRVAPHQRRQVRHVGPPRPLRPLTGFQP